MPEWPLERVLDGVAAAGFAGVGLDRYTVADYVASGGRVEEIADLLRTRDLACTDVGVLPVGTPGFADAAKELAQLATVTGAGLCLAAHYRPASQGESVRQLAEAGAVLAEAGARIALEFVSYGVRRTMTEARELCEAVGWERCGLLVDTWHVFRGAEPLSLVRSLGSEQIALVHLNDGARVPAADPTVEGRRGRLPVGAGDFPLADFAMALEATGYVGVLSTEVLSTAIRMRPPENGARRLMLSLRDCWPGSA